MTRDLTSRETDRLLAFTHRHPGPCSLQYFQTGVGIAVWVEAADGTRVDLTDWGMM